MIKYTLACSQGCSFEAWFQNSAACTEQLEAQQVACPACGSTDIQKALMAPRLGASSKEQAPPRNAPTPSAENQQRMMEHALRAMRAHVENNADNVGADFAAEARRIHDGEAEARAIYGDATPDEVEDLIDDDIPVAKIPWINRRDD